MFLSINDRCTHKDHTCQRTVLEYGELFNSLLHINHLRERIEDWGMEHFDARKIRLCLLTKDYIQNVSSTEVPDRERCSMLRRWHDASLYSSLCNKREGQESAAVIIDTKEGSSGEDVFVGREVFSRKSCDCQDCSFVWTGCRLDAMYLQVEKNFQEIDKVLSR